MIQQKGILAKLLSKENITVQHGNFRTAWFDVKNRVLGLPLWKDMDKDVYDLLIGHEVGHALFTPFEGWHDSPEKLEGCPRSYINVIEDARIEKCIRRTYAGLIGPMARGYKNLFDQGFFGVDQIEDWNEIKLIDKINLKTKLRNLIDVPFTSEEKVFYDRSLKTETFEEVIQLVKDIYEWTKENQEELLTPPPPPEGLTSDMKGEMDEDPSPNQGHDDQIPSEEEEEELQENPFETQETDSDGDAELEQLGEGTILAEQPDPIENEVSNTDESFRDSEKKLVDLDEYGNQPRTGSIFTKKHAMRHVTEFKELNELRQKRIRGNNTLSSIEEDYNAYREDFKNYLKEVKSSVYYAVKEFEMRKAAYRWTRSQTARSGSLDVNKLWAYKTNDDIFNRVTRLADAKNHGMMMLIDFSGSMSNVMGQVLDQVLHLSLFCRTVNIPFSVYGFTTHRKDYEKRGYTPISGQINLGSLSLVELTNSRLSKALYDESLYHMYVRKVINGNGDFLEYEEYWRLRHLEDRILADEEEYGSTPLNESLLVFDYLIDDFKARNPIDKFNLVVISDGDANSLHINPTYEANNDVTTKSYGDINLFLRGKRLQLEPYSKTATKSMLEYLQKVQGANTIGFFISEKAWNFNNILDRAYNEKNKSSSWDPRAEDEFRKLCQREFSKNKCVAMNDVFGYNEFYLLKKSAGLSTEAEEFNPSEEATKGQMTTAFKKFSKSKKINKVLLTKFGKAVA